MELQFLLFVNQSPHKTKIYLEFRQSLAKFWLRLKEIYQNTDNEAKLKSALSLGKIQAILGEIPELRHMSQFWH